MTCEQCIKFNSCKDEKDCTDYYLEDIACGDVESHCKNFISYDEFKEEHCRSCGTQRCPGDEDAIQTCGHFKEMNKVFEKRAKMLDKQIVNNDSVLSNKDGTDFAISCDCGCKNTIRIEKIIDETGNLISIGFLTDNYYNKQKTIWSIIKEKVKKIKCILTNKDFYHFEIILTSDQFNEFREYIDRLDDKNE